MKQSEIMGLVDALVAAVKKQHIVEEYGSDAEYESADIAVDRARADVKNALHSALPDNA